MLSKHLPPTKIWFRICLACLQYAG